MHRLVELEDEGIAQVWQKYYVEDPLYDEEGLDCNGVLWGIVDRGARTLNLVGSRKNKMDTTSMAAGPFPIKNRPKDREQLLTIDNDRQQRTNKQTHQPTCQPSGRVCSHASTQARQHTPNDAKCRTLRYSFSVTTRGRISITFPCALECFRSVVATQRTSSSRHGKGTVTPATKRWSPNKLKIFTIGTVQVMASEDLYIISNDGDVVCNC